MPQLKTAGETPPPGSEPAPVGQPGPPTEVEAPEQPEQSRASTASRYEFAPPAKGRRAWKLTWILAYENLGTVRAACKAARVSVSRVYEARIEDPAFGAAWKEAEERITELLEETAVMKALDGDGRMIEFMLKARRPGKYREQATGPNERAEEEISQGVNEAIEGMASEIERLTERLADVAPAGEAESPRAAAGGAVASAG